MTHTFLYTHDNETNQNAIIYIGIAAAKIWRTGVKPYEKNFYAEKFLKSIMEEKIELPEPDEIVKKEPDETRKEFINRIAGDLERIASYERVFPQNPTKSAEEPKTFYKCFNIFPPMDIWYETQKEAKKDADGIDTVYIGTVEVYDPDEIKRIEDEIASYPG